jgi:hypothetical protein
MSDMVWLGFSVIAMFLAAIGICGMLSYYVLQRRVEIGTRIALGAQRGDILKMILGHAVELVIAGMGYWAGRFVCGGAGADESTFWRETYGPANFPQRVRLASGRSSDGLLHSCCACNRDGSPGGLEKRLTLPVAVLTMRRSISKELVPFDS